MRRHRGRGASTGRALSPRSPNGTLLDRVSAAIEGDFKGDQYFIFGWPRVMKLFEDGLQTCKR